MTERPVAPIAWHARLEARMLLVIVATAALSLAAVLATTRAIITRESLARAADDLTAARAAFSRLADTRRQTAANATRLIVELPVFRASLAAPEVAADVATIDHMTEEYCSKLGADLCVVTDADGHWRGRAGAGLHQAPGHVFDTPLQAALGGASGSGLIAVDSALYLVVAEPALFGREVIGTFAAGFRFDDRVAADLSAATNSEVTFLCGRLCGSSLPEPARGSLAALLAQAPETLNALIGGTAPHRIGTTEYVGGLYPLGDGDHTLALVLLKDWTPTAQALGRLNGLLWWATGLTLAIAVAGTVVFGRRLTRPIRDLAAAATEIAAGRWQRHVPARGPVETRRMAAAFNHMTEVLRASHDQIQRRTAELHAAYERFRAITDSAQDAIVSVDAFGMIQFWNPGAERLFGYTPAEAVSRPLTLLVPEDRREEATSIFESLIGGTSPWLGRTVECRARRRDGTTVAVEVALATWTAGTDRFLTGIVRDVSERHEAARALKDREDQLRQAQKMEAVGRLAGGIAHDFNNVLTAILGYTDLLLEETPAAAPARGPLTEIQRAGRHAASLTKDLLAFSRKQVLQPVIVDVNAIVANTESLLRRLIGESVALTLALEPGPHCVKADPDQLTQVLVNLIVNARDAMPEGGRVTVGTARAASGDVQVTVADTGCGMTPEVRAHIFEPFFTTKGVGRGTGLGLATVYGIVQQSGGRIAVESVPGEGTTFTVSLPATAGVPAEADQAAPEANAAASGAERILLVEDNDAVRRMARETLVAAGYVVLEARDGTEALRLAAEVRLESIDAVVTDVVMPLMGGRELVARLRALRPDLSVVFTSGYASDPATAQHASAIGAAFLQKPFVPSTLRRKLRETLDAHTTRVA